MVEMEMANASHVLQPGLVPHTWRRGAGDRWSCIDHFLCSKALIRGGLLGRYGAWSERRFRMSEHALLGLEINLGAVGATPLKRKRMQTHEGFRLKRNDRVFVKGRSEEDKVLFGIKLDEALQECSELTDCVEAIEATSTELEGLAEPLAWNTSSIEQFLEDDTPRRQRRETVG